MMAYDGDPRTKEVNYDHLQKLLPPYEDDTIISKQGQWGIDQALANRNEIDTEVNMRQMICITVYNEPYIQILQSLAGIYRNYYEILEYDQEFEDKLSVVIVWDGYKAFDEGSNKGEGDSLNSERFKKIGLFDPRKTERYRKKISDLENPNNDEEKYDYAPLNFLENLKHNEENKKISFETKNVAHCFSRKIKFEEFLFALTPHELDGFKINGYDIIDFLYGDSKTGNIKKRKYTSLPIDIHFVIKHNNKGKIESHLWFFKGFCNTVRPKYATIIDAGTIPLWKSISRLTFFWEINQKVGGAWGEIEVMLNSKHEDGSPVTFFESILLRAQYVEYKQSHYLDK